MYFIDATVTALPATLPYIRLTEMNECVINAKLFDVVVAINLVRLCEVSKLWSGQTSALISMVKYLVLQSTVTDSRNRFMIQS